MKKGKLFYGLLLLLSIMLTASLILSGCGTKTTPPATTPKSTTATAAPTSTAPAATAKPTPTTAAPSSTTAPAATIKPVTLTLVSGYADLDPSGTFVKPFIELVKKNSNGAITIKYLGGPEIMSSNDQANALMSGIIDINFNPVTRYSGSLPAVGIYTLSRISAAEERKNGYYALLVDTFKQKNIRYLARGLTPTLFYMSLNKQITKPDELTGLKIRSTATYAAFLKSLGAVGVNIPDTDTYNSMQTGVLQGYILPIWSQVESKMFEVTKYFVDYPIYTSGSTGFLMNLDSFNKLEKPAQDVILASSEQIEQQVFAHFTNLGKTARDEYIAKGVKPISFSAEDAKKYVDVAYNAAWDELSANTKVPADVITKAKQLSVK